MLRKEESRDGQRVHICRVSIFSLLILGRIKAERVRNPVYSLLPALMDSDSEAHSASNKGIIKLHASSHYLITTKVRKESLPVVPGFAG